MKKLTLISSWWLLALQINAVGQLPAVTAHGKYLIRFPIGNFKGTMHRKFQVIASLKVLYMPMFISSWLLLSVQINAVGQLPAVTAHGKYLIRFPIGNFTGTMHRKFQVIASLWRFCTCMLLEVYIPSIPADICIAVCITTTGHKL